MGQSDEHGIWIPPGAKLRNTEPADSTPDEGGESAEMALAEAAADAEAAAAAEAEQADYRDKYLRALAEMDNLRKRLTEQQRLAVQRANESFVLDLLPTLDAVQRGIEAAGQGASVESLMGGLELVAKQLGSFLESHGVEVIACEVGDPFDPAQHEAMMRLPATDEAPEGHVAKVIDEGFRLHGRVVRPTRVAVSAPALDVSAD